MTAQGLTTFLQERSKNPDLVVRDVNWASAYHMNARLAAKYRVQRIFLVGKF